MRGIAIGITLVTALTAACSATETPPEAVTDASEEPVVDTGISEEAIRAALDKYFCRSTSTILAGFGRLLVRRRTVRWALLRVLKTQKTKRRERPLGDVHGVR